MEHDTLTIIVIVAYHNLLDLAVFAHLTPKILIERVEMVLQLAWIHFILRIVRRVLVEIREEDSLRV